MPVQKKSACRQGEIESPQQIDTDHAVRAINRLVSARYELELAMRAPGEIISITRQSLDSVLNDLGIVERLIRELAER